MFRASSCPSSGAITTAVAGSDLSSEFGDSSVVGRGRAGRPAGSTTKTARLSLRYDTKVKPENATAVIELLMMGGRTPETC
jgi:hypothetical protein